MRTAFLIGFILLGTASAFAAEEPSGCDKFKWPIEQERTALTAPDRVKLSSGGELVTPPTTGIALTLVPPADAKLPTPPERTPKEGTFAAYINFKNVAKAGLYTISLSAGAWIDVVQDGHSLKPKGFSGAPRVAGGEKFVNSL